MKLIVDVNGAYPATSDFASLAPARLLETRTGPGLGTVDGESNGIGVRAAGQETRVRVVGRAGVPAGAQAVVLNVAVADAVAAGFVTVYPCGTARPNASNVNYVAGQTIAS